MGQNNNFLERVKKKIVLETVNIYHTYEVLEQ